MALVSTGDVIINYNGVQLGPYYTSQISATPVMDSSGRTTKYMKFTLKFEGVAEPNPIDTTTDNALSAMRQRLAQNGGQLQFSGLGYGAIKININDVKDVEYGPKVTVFDWRPGGGPGLCAHVKWECVTCIPVCSNALFENALMEYNTTLEHDIDEEGYSKITTTGHLEIPVTRVAPGNPALADHVDRYRIRFQNIIPPAGFKRTSWSWKINEARTRADFSYAIEEIRDALPPNCVRAEITYKSGAQMPFVMWKNHISGNIVVPSNISKEWALSVFLTLINVRMTAARSGFTQDLPALRQFFNNISGSNANTTRQNLFGTANAQQLGRLAAIPEHFELSNRLDGRGVNFNFNFRVLRFNSLENCVRGNGVWIPLGEGFHNSDLWRGWRDSLRELGVYDPRGIPQVAWSSNADAIVDLCSQPPRSGSRPQSSANTPDTRQPPTTPPTPPRSGEVSSTEGEVPDDVTGADPGLATLPNSDQNWLMFQMTVDYQEPTGIYAYHQPLAGTLRSPSLGYDPDGSASNIRNTRGGAVGSTQWQGATSTLQEVGPPRPVVFLRGKALRVGQDIPLPNLLAIRGTTVKLNRVISTPSTTVGRYGDLRLVYREWELEYFLNAPPTRSLPMPANPTLGFNGTT